MGPRDLLRREFTEALQEKLGGLIRPNLLDLELKAVVRISSEADIQRGSESRIKADRNAEYR